MALAQKYTSPASEPRLKIIIQDRQEVIQAGVDIWKKEIPKSYDSGAVSFQGKQRGYWSILFHDID
jgi:hypothetical protein